MKGKKWFSSRIWRFVKFPLLRSVFHNPFNEEFSAEFSIHVSGKMVFSAQVSPRLMKNHFWCISEDRHMDAVIDILCALKLFIDFNYFCVWLHIESMKKIESFAGTKVKLFCVKRYLCSTMLETKAHKKKNWKHFFHCLEFKKWSWEFRSDALGAVKTCLHSPDCFV